MEKESIRANIQVGLHWLTVTVFVQASLLVPPLMKALFGITLPETEEHEEGEWRKHFFEFGGGARGFNSLCIGPFGIKLYRLPRNGNYCSLEFSGQVIEKIGEESVLAFLHYLNADNPNGWRWHATRIDIAFDNCPFTPKLCRDAFIAGNVRTDAQSDSYRWLESPEGDTFYIGSRSSTRFLRIYDRRGPTRFEFEVKKPLAERVAKRIAESEFDDWRDYVFGLVRQYVDFVDASSAKTLKACTLLPWWAEFVGNVGQSVEPIKGAKVARNLLFSTNDYLARLLPSLCVIRLGLGISLDVMCEGSEYRLKEHHHRKIAALRQALGEDTWIP